MLRRRAVMEQSPMAEGTYAGGMRPAKREMKRRGME